MLIWPSLTLQFVLFIQHVRKKKLWYRDTSNEKKSGACKINAKWQIFVFTVKSGVLFPPSIATLASILQCSCANCSEQVAPELASCDYSILTNLLISIFSWQIFANENTAKQYLVAWKYFYQRKSARKILKSTNLLKFIVATCKFRCNLLGAISAWTLQYWRQCCDIGEGGGAEHLIWL